MSREVRRPVRYLNEAELGPAPVQPVDAATLSRSAERFQRTLGALPQRRQATGPKPGTSRDDDAGSPRAPARQQSASAAPPAAPHAPAAPAASALGPLNFGNVGAVAARGAVGAGIDGDDPDAPLEPLDLSWWKGPIAAQADKWPEEMAETIVSMFRRSDPAFTGWTVTVVLDKEVLPDTELRLELSPHWLALRFTTRSPQSSRLLYVHRDRLQTLLERVPDLPHGIDIDIA